MHAAARPEPQPQPAPRQPQLSLADAKPEPWQPIQGETVAIVPPDWEITNPAAPRAMAEVVELAGDLVTVTVLGHLRLRRLHQVAPWTGKDNEEAAR